MNDKKVLQKKRIEWSLDPQDLAFFTKVRNERTKSGSPYVLWGWKRDKVDKGKRLPESRTVYFSADLDAYQNKVFLTRAYFFLESRAKEKEIILLKKQIAVKTKPGGFSVKLSDEQDSRYKGFRRLRIEIGEPNGYDKQTVTRRLLGKPRLKIEAPKIIEETGEYDIRDFSPLALYCGSGLSSESGLPLLGSIHGVFAVDDTKSGELIFGAQDQLPKHLAEDIHAEFRKFCKFDIQAIKAKPAASHLIVANWHKQGLVRQVFTDNVDDILKKVGVPYVQTRSSIFPDRFPVKFGKEIRGLLVVGISVDRRDVIRQARRQGLKIIVINPVLGVAPYSRNMDYLSKGDIFIKAKAREVLKKIETASGF